MLRSTLAAVLLVNVFLSIPSPHQKNETSKEFFPFRIGTYWVYTGTVRWYDNETDKPASTDVTWKMTVERVIRRKGVVAAVVSGYPADLDFTAGTTEPKPWLLLENEDHQIYFENLGPDYDLAKLEGDDHVFDKFMTSENVFFQWPLKPGAKYCSEEAKNREDEMYCWVVAEVKARKSAAIKGIGGGEQTIYRLQYRTNPDDTSVELLPGVGLLSYKYHHHGTVADTELELTEYHAADQKADAGESKP
jgi:hypothetical protein